MNDGLAKIIEAYAKPVATPPSVTSREIAWKAIEFDSPERIPYSLITPFPYPHGRGNSPWSWALAFSIERTVS